MLEVAYIIIRPIAGACNYACGFCFFWLWNDTLMVKLDLYLNVCRRFSCVPKRRFNLVQVVHDVSREVGPLKRLRASENTLDSRTSVNITTRSQESIGGSSGTVQGHSPGGQSWGTVLDS